MIEVNCPNCGQPVKAENPKNAVECPHCSTRFRVQISQMTGTISDFAKGDSSSLPGVKSRGSFSDTFMESKTIHGYDIIEPIGAGGMGMVYKARQASLDRIVAMKVMRGTQFSDPDLQTRFVREVKTAGGLQHPGIVPVYDAGESDGTLFYTMEFVEGKTIKEYVLGKEMSVREITELMLHVADALAYAHEMGVVHRDLKPGNIIVDKRGRPRILDFGLAKWSKSGQEGVSSVTVTGMPMGTPGYMSPEQSMGRWQEVDTRTDVFALGVITYELLTGGKHPFDVDFTKDGAYEVIKKINELKPRRLPAVNPQVDPVLWRIIETSLEKKCEKRYATANEFGEALREYLTQFDSVSLIQLSKRRNLTRVVLPLLIVVCVFLAFVAVHNLFWYRQVSSALDKGEFAKVEVFLTRTPPLADALDLNKTFAARYVSEWLTRNYKLLRDRNDRDWKQVIAAIRGSEKLATVREGAARQFLRDALLVAGEMPGDLRYSIMKRLREAAGPSGARLFGDEDVLVGYLLQDAVAWRDGEAKRLAFKLERPLTVGKVNLPTIFIPSGVFLMGSPGVDADSGANERPVVWRTVARPVYMSRTEITMAQFAHVMGLPAPENEAIANLPAFGVSHADATAFCKRLSELTGASVRLPTEAEWEYACRSGTSTRFYWGDQPDASAEHEWTRSNSQGRLQPVAQKRPNAWGLFDMGGNVEEWCKDIYDDAGAAVLKSDVRSAHPVKRQVLRGGSWLADPSACRSAVRRGGFPTEKWPTRGFRIVVEVK